MPINYRFSFLMVCALAAVSFADGQPAQDEALPVLAPEIVPYEPRGGICLAERFRVFPETGQLVFRETDMQMHGSPLAPVIQRFYSPATNEPSDEDGPFGPGWHTIFSRRILKVPAAGSADGTLMLFDEWGRKIPLDSKEGGGWITRFGAPLTIDGPLGKSRLHDLNGLIWEMGESGYPVAVSDAHGNRVRIDRDAQRPWVIKEIESETGEVLSIESDEVGRIVKIAGNDGQIIQCSYQNGALAEVRKDGAVARSYAYDDKGRLAEIRFSSGLTVQTAFDDRGRVVRLEGPGLSRTYSYPAPGKNSRTDGRGRRSEWSVGESPDRLSVLSETGATLEVRRDDRRRPVRLRLGGSSEWRWRYDREGRLREYMNPANELARLIYDADRLTRIESPDGRLTRLRYDDQERLAGVSRGTLAPWRFEYDESGRLQYFEDYYRTSYTLEYDDTGRIESCKSSAGANYGLQRGPRGRIDSIGLPGGPTIRFERNTQGRVTRVGDSIEWIQFGYTPSGNVASVEGSQGLLRRFYYADNGSVAVLQQPGERQTRLVYDAEASCIAIRRATRTTLNLSRGPLGRVEILDHGQNERWRADFGDGIHPNRLSRPGFEPVLLQHDSIGRITEARQDDKTRLGLEYRGDAIPSAVETRLHHWRFSFDPAGRLQSIAEQNGAKRESFEYGSDNRVLRHGKPGWTERVQYDPTGNVIALTIASPAAIAFRFGYDTRGRLQTIVYPNDVRTQFEYDSASRLSRTRTRNIYAETLVVIDAEYSSGSRLVAATGLGTDRFSFQYDANLDLVGIAHPDGRRDTFRYGKLGNLLQADSNGRRKLYQHTPGGQPDQIANRKYVYGVAGGSRPAGSGSETVLMLDDLDRVVGLQEGDKLEVRYDYLPDGRLARRAINGQALAYEWEGSRLRAIRDAKGRIVIALHYDPQFGIPLAVSLEEQMYYCHPDIFGTPIRITDSKGNAVAPPEDFPIAIASISEPLLTPSWVGLPPAIRLVEENLILVRGRLCDPETATQLSPEPSRSFEFLNPHHARQVPRPLELSFVWEDLANVLGWIEEIESHRLETAWSGSLSQVAPLSRLCRWVRRPETYEDELLRQAFQAGPRLERWLDPFGNPSAQGEFPGLPMSALKPTESSHKVFLEFSPIAPIPYAWSDDLNRLVPGEAAEFF